MSLNEKMTRLADSIRALTSDTKPMNLDAMAEAIENHVCGQGGALAARANDTITEIKASDLTGTAIAPYAFYEGSNITKVTIPATITEIGEEAFNGTGITEVHFEGTKKQWNAISAPNNNKIRDSATVYCSNAILVPGKTVNNAYIKDGKGYTANTLDAVKQLSHGSLIDYSASGSIQSYGDGFIVRSGLIDQITLVKSGDNISAYADYIQNTLSGKVCDVPGNYSCLILSGWANPGARRITYFGYQIDDGEAVFSQDWTKEDSALVSALGGAVNARRFINMEIPVRLLAPGAHKIRPLVVTTDGTYSAVQLLDGWGAFTYVKKGEYQSKSNSSVFYTKVGSTIYKGTTAISASVVTDDFSDKWIVGGTKTELTVKSDGKTCRKATTVTDL